MKKLLFKVVGVFLPKNVKVWFPAIGKVVVLVAGLAAVLGYPELSVQLIQLAIDTVGEDTAFIGLVGTALAAAVKISHELVSDIQVARGKPPLGKPVVQSVLGHEVYSEEYQKAYDRTHDYNKSVKTATGIAQEFEKVQAREYLRLINEEGLPNNVAFVRSRNLAKAATQQGRD